MSSLVFLGAGASRPFGIPTMQEMVTEFEKKLKDDDKECFEFYSQIKEILVEKYRSGNVDIESILSVLHGIISQIKAKDLGYYAYYHIQIFCKAQNITYPEGRPIDEYIEKAKKTEDFLKKYIRTSCEIELSKSKRQEVYEKSYLSLFKNIKGEKQGYPKHSLVRDWKAYTTNYDNIFERFWEVFERPLDHFEKEPNSNNNFFSLKALPVHSFCKLHGSLDWTQEKETGRVIREQNSGYSIYDTEGEVMLFPIQQKDLYLHPWFTLFFDLRVGLQQQSVWYAIGYAFNDDFIRNVFQERLSHNPEKRLVIINPNAEKIIYKFSELVRNQIDVLPIKFGGEYFDLQLADYVGSVKTILVRIVSTSKLIRIKCNKKIQSHDITDSDKIGIKNTTLLDDSKEIFIELANPTDQEIKIELKIEYKFGDNVELFLSDTTEKLNFGIDYCGLKIASSNEILGYDDIEGIIWMRNSVILDKSKLFRC